MKKILFALFFVAVFSTLTFAQETLNVYRKTASGIDENSPVGTLVFTDQIRELPLPMDSVKKVTVVKERVEIKDRKGNVKRDKKGNPKYDLKTRKNIAERLLEYFQKQDLQLCAQPLPVLHHMPWHDSSTTERNPCTGSTWYP